MNNNILKIAYTPMFMQDILPLVLGIWYLRYSRYILYNSTWLVMFKLFIIKRKLEQNYRIKSNQIEDELNLKRFNM